MQYPNVSPSDARAPGFSDGGAAAPGFDEAFYRQANADVAAAIAAGSYASGLEHYLAHGRAEGRLPTARAEQDHGAKVNEVWSADTQARTDREGWYWMAHPAVRARLAVLASGDPAVDAYDHLADLLRQRGWTLPIRRSLSLGCGFGNLERDLTHRGLIGEIEAYDLAEGAIEKARELAAAAGYGNIRYHVADLEVHELPRDGFDVVFAHQSVHHVDRLEHMFARVAAALRPGGIFHLHEFVGPIRFQWTDAQIGLINSYLASLPPELRRLPSGEAKPLQGRPTIAAMIAADPSEAIRSSDIRTALAAQFKIIEERPLGGTLAHLALAGIAQNFDADRADHRAKLQELFDLEDAETRQGTIGSDFVVLTALKA